MIPGGDRLDPPGGKVNAGFADHDAVQHPDIRQGHRLLQAGGDGIQPFQPAAQDGLCHASGETTPAQTMGEAGTSLGQNRVYRGV